MHLLLRQVSGWRAQSWLLSAADGCACAAGRSAPAASQRASGHAGRCCRRGDAVCVRPVRLLASAHVDREITFSTSKLWLLVKQVSGMGESERRRARAGPVPRGAAQIWLNRLGARG